MGHSYDGAERREYLRFPKNFSMSFHFKDSPGKKSDGTFSKDISKGGIRFTTSEPIKEGTHLVFEIGIPYIAPKKLTIGGLVISSREITPRLVYEIRTKFDPMDDQALQLFDLIEKRNPKDPKTYGLH